MPRRVLDEYAFRGRIFYVGISWWSTVRSHGRWANVRNLVQHEQAGTLKPDKRRELDRKSNQVIAALIRAEEPTSRNYKRSLSPLA